MIQTGKVVASKGSQIQVCFQRPEMCAHCKMCDTGLKEDGTVITLNGHAAPGDMVEVYLPEKQLLRHTAAAYLIPLLALLLGLLIGSLLSFSEALQAVTALIFTGLGLLCVRLYDRYLSGKKNALPSIVRVLPAAEQDK